MQVKSKKRVNEHGEVFTNEREVNAMLDLVKDSFNEIDSTFLEPSVGEGNFAIKILERKVELVKKTYSRTSRSYIKGLIRAISSLYGIELLTDNCEICKDRLYKYMCNQTRSKKALDTIKMIIDKNIVNGNTLTYLTITGEPIRFTEWKFNGNILVGTEHTFQSMMS